MKKIIGIICVLCMFFAISTTAFAETVNVSATGTGYTSRKYLGTKHSTYYSCLTAVKFVDLSQNVIPSGYYVYTRIRTDLGDKCGDLGTFSQTGTGYYYNYWSGCGGSGWYKLATNSSYGSAYSADITWWP